MYTEIETDANVDADEDNASIGSMELKFQCNSPRDLFENSDDDFQASDSYSDLAIQLAGCLTEASKKQSSGAASVIRDEATDNVAFSKVIDENEAPTVKENSAVSTEEDTLKTPVQRPGLLALKQSVPPKQTPPSAAVKPPFSSNKTLSKNSLNQHLDRILTHKHRTWFERPVTDKQAPGYSRFYKMALISYRIAIE